MVKRLSIADGCPGCSRRELVAGLGVVAASALLGGACRDGDTEPAVDAGDPLAGTTMCGTSLCVALNDPVNARLQAPGGSRVITLPDDKIMVLRRSDTAFAVLTALCTHEGCTVSYNEAGDRFVCPCHGSQYTVGGAVTRGPATQSLAKYSFAFDAATQVLTIELA